MAYKTLSRARRVTRREEDTDTHSRRRVAPASSLSARFQQVHEARSRGTASTHAGQAIQKPRHAQPAARRALQHVSTRMDIDQVDRPAVTSGRGRGRQNNRSGSSARGGGSSPRGRGRDGQRARGRGRGRGRGGRTGEGTARRRPLNKDNLDMDLDSYMMGDAKAGRTILDQDLDNYMQSSAAA